LDLKSTTIGESAKRYVRPTHQGPRNLTNCRLHRNKRQRRCLFRAYFVCTSATVTSAPAAGCARISSHNIGSSSRTVQSRHQSTAGKPNWSSEEQSASLKPLVLVRCCGAPFVGEGRRLGAAAVDSPGAVGTTVRGV